MCFFKRNTDDVAVVYLKQCITSGFIILRILDKNKNSPRDCLGFLDSGDCYSFDTDFFLLHSGI